MVVKKGQSYDIASLAVGKAYYSRKWPVAGHSNGRGREMVKARMLIISLILLTFILLVSTSFQAQVRANPGPDYIVAEYGSGELSRVAPDGTVTLIASGLSSPYCVAIESSGDFIVTEGPNGVPNTNGKLLRVTPSGTVTTIATGLSTPVGVAIDSSGNFIVAEDSGRRLSRVTPGGVVTTIVDMWSWPDYPTGVAIDGSGNYIVATGGGRVLRVTPGGVVTEVATGLNWLNGIAVDSFGNYIVAASTDQKLLLVTPAGGVTTIVSGSYLIHVAGVAIDTLGNYIVAADDLLEVTPGGVVTTIAAGLSTPWGVAVESEALAPVGGVVMPANMFAILGPLLAVIGLVGCVGIVVAKKRRQ